jgi:hypothetical protein
MGDLSNFEREQIVGASLAGTSVTKTATLLGLSSIRASKLMLAHTNHGKTTSAKRNSGQKSSDRKRALYIEKNCLKKSQNYCITGDSILKTLFPQKLSDISFTNPTSMVGLQF